MHFMTKALSLLFVLLLLAACNSELETGRYAMSASNVEGGCTGIDEAEEGEDEGDLEELEESDVEWVWVISEGDDADTLLVTEEFDGRAGDTFTLTRDGGQYVYTDSWKEEEDNEHVSYCQQGGGSIEVSGSRNGLRGTMSMNMSDCSEEGTASCSWTADLQGDKLD